MTFWGSPLTTAFFSFCGTSFSDARKGLAWTRLLKSKRGFIQNKNYFSSPFLPNLEHSQRTFQGNDGHVTSRAILSDQERWERMYQEGSRREEKAFVDAMSYDDYQSANLKGEGAEAVRVITFDLDNTLWKTGPVIGSANEALNNFMEDSNLQVPMKVEHFMRELFKSNPSTYNPSLEMEKRNAVDGGGSAPEYADGKAGQSESGKSSPVLLTKLRKDAITKICIDHNNFHLEDAKDFSERAFNVWTSARHEAIPNNFANDVIATLVQLRKITTPEGHPIVIGAITDGNSDPRKVTELEPIFDFCVNAEGVGVSKPNERVYKKAVEILFNGDHPAISAYIDDDFTTNSSVPESVGRWWVHVGDDFIKDIVAAKQMNMRSVWSTELIAEKIKNKGQNEDSTKKENSRDVEDLLRDVSSKPVVEMSIGTKDFLAETVLEEFVDARISCFSDLLNTINGWNNEYTMLSGVDKTQTLEDAEVAINDAESHFDAGDISSVGEIVSTPSRTLSKEDKEFDQAKIETKFCIFCGTKNANVAKFCIACGKKQPKLA